MSYGRDGRSSICMEWLGHRPYLRENEHCELSETYDLNLTAEPPGSCFDCFVDIVVFRHSRKVELVRNTTSL